MFDNSSCAKSVAKPNSTELLTLTFHAPSPAGLTSMEVDMHNDPAMWCAKMDKLQRLLRHLRCVVIHVNAAISDNMIFHNIALVQQLKGVSVGIEPYRAAHHGCRA